MRFLFILALTIFGISKNAEACSCIFSNTHRESLNRLVQTAANTWKTDIPVFYVQIKEHVEDTQLKVVIKDVVYGKQTVNSELLIRAGDGANCSPYVDEFPVGTEWVMALNQWSDGGESFYGISICGVYYIPVQTVNGQLVVKGDLDQNIKEMKYVDYKSWIQAVLNPSVSEIIQMGKTKISCEVSNAIENNHSIYASNYNRGQFQIKDKELKVSTEGLKWDYDSSSPIVVQELVERAKIKTTLTAFDEISYSPVDGESQVKNRNFTYTLVTVIDKKEYKFSGRTGYNLDAVSALKDFDLIQWQTYQIPSQVLGYDFNFYISLSCNVRKGKN